MSMTRRSKHGCSPARTSSTKPPPPAARLLVQGSPGDPAVRTRGGLGRDGESEHGQHARDSEKDETERCSHGGPPVVSPFFKSADETPRDMGRLLPSL